MAPGASPRLKNRESDSRPMDEPSINVSTWKRNAFHRHAKSVGGIVCSMIGMGFAVSGQMNPFLGSIAGQECHKFLIFGFDSVGIGVERPSVRLFLAKATIGSHLEMPFVSSSPLAPCQRKHMMTDMLKCVVSAWINRTEGDDRSVAICV